MTEDFKKYARNFLGEWSRIDNPGETTDFYLLINNFEGLKIIANEACKYKISLINKDNTELIEKTKNIYQNFIKELEEQEEIYYNEKSNQPGAYN